MSSLFLVPRANTKKWFLLFAWLGFSLLTNAQAVKLNLNQNVSLKKQSYLLKDLMAQLTLQCNVAVAYDSKKVSSTTKIRITKVKLNVKTLLNLIQQQAGICNKQRGNYLILLPKLSERIFRKKKIRTLVPFPVVTKSDSLIKTTDTITAPIQTLGDGTIVKSINDTIPAKYGTPVVDYTPSEKKVEPSYPTIPAYLRAVDPLNAFYLKDFINRQLLLEVGLVANEMFYVAPVVNVGFKYLHGTACLYKKADKTFWRLGIESTVPINPKWSIQAGYQFGQSVKNANSYAETLSTIVQVDSTKEDTSYTPIDSTIFSSSSFIVDAVGKWSTISLTTKYQWKENILFSAGFTYNVVKSVYSVSSPPQEVLDDTKLPETFKTPYSIGGKSPPGFPSRTQQWIGFQVSILYSF